MKYILNRYTLICSILFTLIFSMNLMSPVRYSAVIAVVICGTLLGVVVGALLYLLLKKKTAASN